MRQNLHDKKWREVYLRDRIWGPMLFLLYINNLDQWIEDSQMVMFANDTTNLNCKQNAKPLHDSDTGHMLKWFVDDKLTLNIGKCDVMYFGSKQPHDVFVMGKALTYQKPCTYLGTNPISGVRYRGHIDYVIENF